MEEYVADPSPFHEFSLLSHSPLISPEVPYENDEDNTSKSTSETSSYFLQPKKELTKRTSCNCKRTKCIKLYCECFAHGLFCNDCGCIDCSNTLQNNKTRLDAIAQITVKNPEAFLHRREILNTSCNCKRSGCRKKYCACFSTGRKCGLKCKCLACRNQKVRRE